MRQKELRMAWQVEKEGKRSFFVGTAHFFPYSFKKSLSKMLDESRIALFEGPLDRESMEKVLRAGSLEGGESPLLRDLDERSVSEIKKTVIPTCRRRRSLFVLRRRRLDVEDPLLSMIRGMKPWLALFTLWTQFLRQKGWESSVDLEAYSLAKETGKEIGHLESIEEQIEVLEGISYERILDFLKRVRHWDEYAEGYVECYLKGDLEGLRSNAYGFPSRHHSVIDQRDLVFYARMKEYLEEGGGLICVGAPHMHGIRELAEADGFTFTQTRE
ncbi:MAG: TraB/GumN family protein [Deltaproteobacteria bacterium]|nr:TraB/GumN family protein [Deltaproteobacteria bacterium]